LKSSDRLVEVWKDLMRLQKMLATLGEAQPPAELLPSKCKEQSPDSLSCLTTLLECFDKNNLEMGAESVARQMHQKTVQRYRINIVKQQVVGGEYPTLRDMSIQPMEAALNQTTFLTRAQALLGNVIGEHTTHQNADVKSIFTKNRQVAPIRMPLGARLAVNAHNVGVRLVESVKNARWSVSSQEARDGLESIVEFQVQIKGHNQRETEYEEKSKDGKIGLMEIFATKLMKHDQQPVLLLPARWWPDTLPEFESEGWWQRPHSRVKCRQCQCGFFENPSLKSDKCRLWV